MGALPFRGALTSGAAAGGGKKAQRRGVLRVFPLPQAAALGTSDAPPSSSATPPDIWLASQPGPSAHLGSRLGPVTRQALEARGRLCGGVDGGAALAPHIPPLPAARIEKGGAAWRMGEGVWSEEA